MTQSDTQEKYADKIAKLLAKAESTTPEEAELLVQKAQELMTEYAIDEAMLAKAGGLESAEKVVEEAIVYKGIFREAAFNIGSALCEPNDCRALIVKGGNTTTLKVIGMEKDVARVKLLDSSLQIQAHGQLLKWQATQDRSWMSNMQWYKARREFLFGFAMGLRTQLAGAAERARKAAGKKYEAKGEASDSVALVLRDKKQKVNDWMDTTYGRLGSVSRRYSSGGHSARSAGHAAGMSADASGRPGVGGNLRSLGR